jgi:hypothetical protein
MSMYDDLHIVLRVRNLVLGVRNLVLGVRNLVLGVRNLVLGVRNFRKFLLLCNRMRSYKFDYRETCLL